jgi:hypothetical protein
MVSDLVFSLPKFYLKKPQQYIAVVLNSRYSQALIPVWQLDYRQLHLDNRDAPY